MGPPHQPNWIKGSLLLNKEQFLLHLQSICQPRWNKYFTLNRAFKSFSSISYYFFTILSFHCAGARRYWFNRGIDHVIISKIVAKSPIDFIMECYNDLKFLGSQGKFFSCFHYFLFPWFSVELAVDPANHELFIT